MAKFIYSWRCEFYTTGGWFKRVYVDAKTREEALNVIRKKYEIIEIRCVERSYTW